MIDFWDLTEEEMLRWEIALAKYLVHFKEHFPVIEVYAFEQIKETDVRELENTVSECIKKDRPYPVPDIPKDATF